MAKEDKKSIKSLVDSKQQSASEWIKRNKEDMDLRSWLKKAQHYESNNDFNQALDFYLRFIELKLHIMKARPGFTVEDFYKLVPYFAKIGDCYKNTRHYKKEDRTKDFIKAAEYYVKAARMYLELKEYPSANVYFEFASKTYEEASLFEKSADAYNEIADMYYKLGNTLIAGASYAKVGELYERAGVYESAYESYVKSAQLSSSLGDVKSAGENYRRAAEIMRKQGKHEDSIDYYVQAAEIGTETGRYGDVAKTYVGMAQNYEETGNLEGAAEYYVKAAEINVDNDTKEASTAFKNAAKCYSKLGKQDKAIEYLKRSATLSAATGAYDASADSFWQIAESYIKLGDLMNAADSFIEYSRYASINRRDNEYMKGYLNAAKLYAQFADSMAEKGSFLEAIELYKKAAANYEQVQDNAKAGDLYFKGGVIEKREDLGDYFDTCTKAALKYKKAGMPYKSAECYLEINEQIQAARDFTQYAEDRLNAGDNFNAAEGFRKAGSCYADLNQKDPMNERLNKANQVYLRYVEKLKKLGISDDDVSNLGEAYFGMAETNRLLRNLLEAKKNFANALDYFEQKDVSEKSVLCRAFLSQIEAKLAIQKGDYELAADFLSKAIESFEESIVQGKWNERYRIFLEGQVEEAMGLQTEIGEKPEITLEVDKDAYSFIDTRLILNMVVSNNGDHAIKKISFLSHLPEGMDVETPPVPIDEIEPKQSIRDFIVLVPKKKGKYRIKPLEVLYEDNRKNKYVKSSNIVSLEIVERPVVEYTNYLDAVGIYERYGDKQLENKNYFYAGEGYKSAAGCFKEVSLKRAADIAKMKNYCQKAADAYTKHLELLEGDRNPSMEKLKEMADTQFNIADCYENIEDFDAAGDYLRGSVENYKNATGKTKSEKQKTLFSAQINVVEAFLFRVDARKAIGVDEYERGEGLLFNALKAFEEALARSWNKEFEEFLKNSQKETQDLLSSIKGKRPSVKKQKSLFEQRADVVSNGKKEKPDVPQSSNEKELNQLLNKKQELELKIENARNRYFQRQLDENMLDKIVEDYQKQLIDADVRISALKKKIEFEANSRKESI